MSTDDCRGWIDYCDSIATNAIERLPLACDRFGEALYFAKKLIALPCDPKCVKEANWIFGAHVTAYSSVRDAAKADFQSIGCGFPGCALDKERHLTQKDDPVSANKAYHNFRNLRVHWAVPMLELRDQPQTDDLRTGELIRRFRWYFRPIAAEAVQRLQNEKERLTDEEIVRINEFLKDRPAVAFISQKLYLLMRAIEETASQVGA